MAANSAFRIDSSHRTQPIVRRINDNQGFQVPARAVSARFLCRSERRFVQDRPFQVDGSGANLNVRGLTPYPAHAIER
jgi:hypothetical protein